MTCTIRKFNDIRYYLNNEVEACRQKIFALETINVELYRKNGMSLIIDKDNALDNQNHNSQNKQKSITGTKWDALEKWEFSLFPKREYPLPIYLILKIRQKAANTVLEKQVYIIQFFNDLAMLDLVINGLGIIWDIPIWN